MGDFVKEAEDKIKKIYQESQNARSEDLFCRKCASYFAYKSDFCEHVREHIEESNYGKTSHMSYIHKHICNICGQQFELKSDLNIHYRTVCLDGPYTCKHCKENCENEPYLQKHLYVHHNYSGEMLRDEGFLSNIHDNFYWSERSFIKSSRSTAFNLPSPEDTLEIHTADNSTSPKASSSNCKSQRVGRKHENVLYNSVNKPHTCEIKPSNVIFCSSIWKKVQPKSKIHGTETSARSVKRKSKIYDIFEDKGKDSRTHKGICRSSNVVADFSAWKKYNLRSRIPNLETSFVQNDPENSKRKIKSRNKHINEINDGRTSYTSCQKYICNICGQQFELKSDLYIHYTIACLDGLYTCKHCKVNCENEPYLQMHLYVHHNYSGEMLRNEGFLSNIHDNFYWSERSFIKSSRYTAFNLPSPEDTLEIHTADKSTSPIASSSNSKSQRVGRKHENVLYNSVNKPHTCEICNESFSRKCVLDMHAKKHVLKRTKEKRMAGSILQKPSTMKSCENTMQESKKTDSAEVPGPHSDSLKALLKPCNVVVCSLTGTKFVPPKIKLPGVKMYVSPRIAMRKSKISDNFEDKGQDSSTRKDVSRPSDVVAENSTSKKLKLRSRLPNFADSCMQNDPENSKKKIKSRNKISDIAASVEQEGPEDLKKNVKRRSKITNYVASDEKKISQIPNIAMNPETRKPKEHKKTPRNLEKRDFICETCKKQFQDNFYLKRHSLIHTGERPYTCTKCKKNFAREDHMKRHLKNVCNKTGN